MEFSARRVKLSLVLLTIDFQVDMRTGWEEIGLARALGAVESRYYAPAWCLAPLAVDVSGWLASWGPSALSSILSELCLCRAAR